MITCSATSRNFTGTAITLFLFPSVCLANGWVSGVNAFRSTPDFYFIFAAIVAVEWIVVARALRPIGVFAALWRVLVINAASSAAGDFLFRVGWAPSSGALWRQAIPFFFLTIAIELPLLCFLLRKHADGWRLISFVALVANVASYMLLVAIDRPVREAWLHRLWTDEQKIVRLWTNTQMFAETSGRLYATELIPYGQSHRLQRFSFGEQRWYSVSNSPALHPTLWDIEGELLAFEPYGDTSAGRVVQVTTLPDCNSIREMELPWTGYRGPPGGEMAISPNGKKLAVLVPVHEIWVPLSASHYQTLGYSCLLVVYDLATGKSAICPRRVLHTIRWMADSERLLFHSVANRNLLTEKTLPKNWKKKYGVDYQEEDPFNRPSVFCYCPATEEVTPVPEITTPLISVHSDHLVGWRDGVLTMLNSVDGTHERVTLGALAPSSSPIISPDRRFAAVSFQMSPFLSRFGYPTIVDLKNPAQRYYLGHLYYRLDWTTANTQTKVHSSDASPARIALNHEEHEGHEDGSRR